jgi:hypothetical protein
MVGKGVVPFQVYEFAPLAVKLMVPPRQLEVGELTEKDGWNTLTVTRLVLLQVVCGLVPVTL